MGDRDLEKEGAKLIVSMGLNVDGKRTIYLSNAPVNAISKAVIEAIHSALDVVEADESVREVVITGDGDKFFSAGADINEIAEFVLAGEGGRKEMAYYEKFNAACEFSRRGHELVLRLKNFPKPVTAVINGLCLGGGFELALGCRTRVAAPNARMGLPEATLGIIPGWGGTRLLAQRMTRVPDPSVLAGVYIQCGYVFDARTALALGIVESILEGEVLDEPDTSVRHVAPRVASRIREFVGRQQEVPEEEAFEEEMNYFAAVCVLPEGEAQEGIRAFLAKPKRKPNFTKS